MHPRIYCIVLSSWHTIRHPLTSSTYVTAGDVTDPNETKYTLEYYLNMADAIVGHGCHSIGIKDMAGLLKPNAATLLIGALRAAHPDVVLHVHTHDSAGTAVATQLAAAAAGADMCDLAMDAMSGCTSQVRVSPSAVVFSSGVIIMVRP